MNSIVVAQTSSPTTISCDFNIDLVGACPMAAVHWPLKYFLDEDLPKNTLNLLSTDKNAHVCGALQEHLQQQIISKQQISVSHSPTTMIGPGGES